jgi:hypothetical protein
MQKRISIVLVLVLGLAMEIANTAVANEAPVADAGPSRYVAQDPVVLDGTGSYDPDNSGPLSYTGRQIAGPEVIIIDANTATPTIAESMQAGTGRDKTFKPVGFTQTDEIQECEFELVVSDGEFSSMPDTVKLIIVPDFGEDTLYLENPAFDADKPTIIYFGGGNCVSGLAVDCVSPFTPDDWLSAANIINFPNGYTPDGGGGRRTYSRYADMIIVYLSSVAPDYKQPIQTSGWSTGGQPAVDVGIRLNLIYADARYAINRVTFFDALRYCRDHYSESISTFLGSSADGEQCWADSYASATSGGSGFVAGPPFQEDVLNVGFPNATGSWYQRHILSYEWYVNSLMPGDLNNFNHGVVAGAYWSVIGPGKNLQLASTPGVQTYRFDWYGESSSGIMDFDDVLNHPGMLPEPVTLIEPVDVGDPNGFVLTCEESENAIGYELLLGADPYRIADYDVISDTPAPPDDVITTLPSDKTWWTVRVRDQYGSTIYADPMSMVSYDPHPSDAATHPDTWADLVWAEGMRADSYNVYFGKNLVDVQEGSAEAFQGNTITTHFTVGFAGFPYPEGLVPGTTYFWRIDDVAADGAAIHKGKIWRFTVSP